jgi:hypothetical protein
MKKLVWATAVAAALAACGGSGGDGSSSASGGSGPVNVVTTTYTRGMDPHAQVQAVAAADNGNSHFAGCHAAGAPRRLTRTQLINSLADVVQQLTGEAALAATVEPTVLDQAQFPPDTLVDPDSSRHTGFERLDTALSSRQASALHQTAETLAKAITADPARVTRLLGNCGSDANACMADFSRRAGRLFFRRPMTDGEVAVYVAAAGGEKTPEAMSKVLATMMASASFYLRVELGQGSGGEGQCVPLSSHELASRLSYQFWDTVPDATLAATADDGSLLDPAVYQAQVARLAAEARADAPTRRFFSRWFKLEELVAMNGKVGNAKFDAFAGSYKPLSTTRNAAIDEVLDMVSYVASRDGSLQQLLTDRHSFARTSDVATLYNTAVWDGKSTPPLFAEADRVGLTTRIGMIANGSSDTTLPIRRGIRVLNALTCQTLPPPAMDQSNAKADLTGVLTTRQRTERVTQMEGTSCIGCHQAQINPFGFVFERFDALGRVRQTEVVRDDSGNSLGEKPIDTAAVATLAGVAARPVATAGEVQQLILDSGAFEKCFARNYARYTFGRPDTADDAELIEALRQQAASGTNIRRLMAAVALRKEFQMIAKVAP